MEWELVADHIEEKMGGKNLPTTKPPCPASSNGSYLQRTDVEKSSLKNST